VKILFDKIVSAIIFSAILIFNFSVSAAPQNFPPPADKESEWYWLDSN
jgi:hypothetical protein